ncbi:hypothetical protein T484DRAFT_1785079 [Baffinella frigidus]|nr:hypothetical protein T484DRAFT_1785079 [Cryptophyta sp. CCMP2293]
MVCGKAGEEGSLAIKIKALGEDHPDVPTTYTNIAFVYDTQGKYEMALELWQRLNIPGLARGCRMVHGETCEEGAGGGEADSERDVGGGR